MYKNDDYLGKYMTECPRSGHRYNKRLHGNKCPDCGYKKAYQNQLICINIGFFTHIEVIYFYKDNSYINMRYYRILKKESRKSL